MPIIVRVPDGNFHNIDVTWDKNRCEVEEAPEKVQEVAKAVCGFVRKDLAPNFLLQDRPNATVRQKVLNELSNAAERRIKDLKDRAQRLLNIEEDAVGKSLQQLKDAQAAIPKNQAAINAAQQKFNDNEYKRDEFRKFITQHVPALDKLEWPSVKHPVAVHVAFEGQHRFATGTGFQIAPGIVMTAQHVLEGASKTEWQEYLAYFHLHNKVRSSQSQQASKWPSWLPYGGRTETVKTYSVQHGSAHRIERVILRGLKDLNAVSPGAQRARKISEKLSEIVDHDVVILQLERSQQEFPAVSLELTDTPPRVDTSGFRPVYALGHPHGVPMKYTGAHRDENDRYSSRPGIIAAPTPDTPRWLHSCIAADLDVFGGNSGGPMLASNPPDSPKKVLGIARHAPHEVISTFKTRLTPFWQAHNKWIWDLGTRAGRKDDDLRKFVASFPPTFEGLAMDKDRRVTWEQFLPDEDSLKDMCAFNRVDLFYPFLNPLDKFLQSGDRAVLVEMTLYLESSKKDLELQPVLMTGSASRVLGHERAWKKWTEESLPGEEISTLTFRWRRLFKSTGDLSKGFESRKSPAGEGDLPNELFLGQGGIALWDKCIVRTPAPAGLSDKGTELSGGKIEVSFGYRCQDPEDATIFLGRLNFNHNLGKTEWTVSRSFHVDWRFTNKVPKAHIGETVHGGLAWLPPIKGKVDARTKSKEEEMDEVMQMIVDD
ncbi:hypothetical protein A1O7_02419 [Cladophialophora yegresii CBS 114405]|uniref:Serine protease n=1 Tax=Cladophialophora yegresii CBS 114405 TaxID=1182544 RepID=W9W1M6_9EURO|nr:uncharacterized protein A1O7_02419 [Cladophialophora yegresii CBS 114405]EXJ61987.1 hypothetical protein A1O7_02419 [Cladophialophora yegresii CBS 114405]